jgi:hypothetical protein
MLADRLERVVGIVEALLEPSDRLLDLAAGGGRRGGGTRADTSGGSRRGPTRFTCAGLRGTRGRASRAVDFAPRVVDFAARVVDRPALRAVDLVVDDLRAGGIVSPVGAGGVDGLN